MGDCKCNDNGCDFDTEKVMEGISKLQIEEGDILILRGMSQMNIMQLGSVLEPVLQEKKAKAIGLTERMSIEKVDRATLKELGLTYVDDTHHTTTSVYEEGGKWIGALRSRVQTDFLNGDSVTWGSDEVLLPEVRIVDLEKLCAAAVAADRNARQQ